MSGFVLYRMFDAKGRLLYVGKTTRVNERMSQHRHNAPFWDQVDTIKLKRFADAESLDRAECLAITIERPQHNSQHNRDPLPRGERNRTKRGEVYYIPERAHNRHVVTFRETAEILGISLYAVRQMVEAGELRSVVIRDKRAILRVALEELLGHPIEVPA